MTTPTTPADEAAIRILGWTHGVSRADLIAGNSDWDYSGIAAELLADPVLGSAFRD